MEVDLKNQDPLASQTLTEAEFHADIEDIVKKSSVEGIMFTIKEHITTFESEKYLNIRSCNDKWIMDIDCLFSSTYNHPVIYFIVYDEEGNCVLIDDVYSYLFENKYDAGLDIFLQKITPKAHPLTQSLAFFIHPCDVNKYYETVYKTTEVKAISKTFFWLSLYFRILRIFLPLEFYEQNKTN